MSLHIRRFGQERRLVLTLILAMTCLLFCTSCIKENTTSTPLVPRLLLGELYVTITEYPSGDPIPNVLCQLEGTHAKYLSDRTGLVLIKNIVDGVYTLRFSGSNYCDASMRITIENRYWGTAEHEKSIQMVESSSRLRLAIAAGDSNQPAANAIVDFQNWSLPSSIERTMHNLPSLVLADSAGIVDLDNLPASEVTIYIKPFDINKDGIEDFEEVRLVEELFSNNTTLVSAVLEPQNNSVSIIGTNVPTSDSMCLESCHLGWTFSSAMNQDSLSVQVFTQTIPPDPVAVELQWTSSTNVKAMPVNSLPYENHKYKITLEGESVAGVAISKIYTLYWTTLIDGIDCHANDGDCADVITELRFAPEQNPIDYWSRRITLEWDDINCDTDYHVYAKDNRYNTDWTGIRLHLASQDSETEHVEIILPENFDSFRADNMVTPFMESEVSICIVPQNSAYPAPGGVHPVLTLSDTTAPSVVSISTSDRGKNTSPSSRLIHYAVEFSEPLSFYHPDPEIETTPMYSDLTSQFDPSRASWEWGADKISGIIEYELLPWEDISLDKVRIYFPMAEDRSGNVTTNDLWSEWVIHDDETSPSAISDLAESGFTSSSVELTFTAPGDDDANGTATYFDLRHLRNNNLYSEWRNAAEHDNEPVPLSSGVVQSINVTGLDPATSYYFAIVTFDECGNFSSISNIASGFTQAVPPQTPQTTEIPAGIFERGDGESTCATILQSITLTRPFMLGNYEITNIEYVSLLQWAYDAGKITVDGTRIIEPLSGYELLDLDNEFYEFIFVADRGQFALRASPSALALDVYATGYDAASHPAKNISWYAAVCYCNWLSEYEGLPPAYDYATWQCNGNDPYGAIGYRLPTEAEWEYATQLGGESLYPWGNHYPSPAYANYSGRHLWSTPVGSYREAPYGTRLYDLAGNVWEWCEDWNRCYLDSLSTVDPVQLEPRPTKCVRGGCFLSDVQMIRCANRHGSQPMNGSHRTGFRIARTTNN
jgi:formylglycine-generating enzyme required for sulfatase activity